MQAGAPIVLLRTLYLECGAEALKQFGNSMWNNCTVMRIIYPEYVIYFSPYETLSKTRFKLDRKRIIRYSIYKTL